MKKFLLFMGDVYYPSGGWEDFKGAFATIEDARAQIKEQWSFEWWHIVDFETKEIIEAKPSPPSTV